MIVDKSVITILDDKKLWTHDMLQEMSQQIVKKQSSKDLGKRGRLWEGEDVCHLLTENILSIIPMHTLYVIAFFAFLFL